jgi:hypothetical protein
MQVHPYMEQKSLISLYYDVNIKKLPPGATLLYDAFPTLPSSLTKKDLQCLQEAFQSYVPYTINNVDSSYFKPNESMDWVEDKPTQFYPYCVILNDGSEVVFELEQNVKPYTNYSFVFPKRSALILPNSTEYKRGFLRDHGVFDGHTVIDAARVGVVLRCEKRK